MVVAALLMLDSVTTSFQSGSHCCFDLVASGQQLFAQRSHGVP